MRYTTSMIQSLRAAVLAAILASGCTAVGHRRIEGPGVDFEGPPDRPRVLLVIISGLRNDTLVNYLRVLRQEDFEPSWHSGLALLGADGFTIAPSSRAEAPLPAGGLAALATLLTGTYPDQHGITGQRFAGYDFEGRDAGRVYFEDGFQPAGASGTPLSRLLLAPTLFERLAGVRRTAAVFHPFGQGASWNVPRDVFTTVTALAPDDSGAAASPLLDEGTRAGAIEVLLAADPPDVVSLAFRSVLTESCSQPDSDCDSGRGDLALVQRHALEAVDGHLWRLLRKYRAARPDAYAATTLLLLGTGGVLDRHGGGPGRGAHALDSAAVRARLAGRSEGACAEWWHDAPMRFSPSGASLWIDLEDAPPGQRRGLRRALGCAEEAIEMTLDDEGWLAGAAWVPPDALGGIGPRASRVKARLQAVFEGAMPVDRRQRALRKMRRAFDDGGRSGEVLLFARAPWHFVAAAPRTVWQTMRRSEMRARWPSSRREAVAISEDIGRPRNAEIGQRARAARRVETLPHPRRHLAATPGGLEDAAVGTAFLVASRQLDDDSARALRTTPIELADVTPTVLALVDAPAETLEGLERPPLLRRDGRAVRLRPADRQIAVPAWRPAPTSTWSEDAESGRVGLVEPTKLWPPEMVTLRLGDSRWTWRSEGDWPADAPCEYGEADGRRSWSCVAALAPGPPTTLVAATRRDPSAADGSTDATDDTLRAIIVGDAAPTIESADLSCASATAAEVRLVARNPHGLASVALEVVDAAGPSVATRRLAEVGGLKAVNCADPLAETCAWTATAPNLDATVSVPFEARLLDHQIRSSRLRRPSRDALARMRSTSSLKPPPRRAYIAVRVCGVEGRCARQALMTDDAYRAALERGCPP